MDGKDTVSGDLLEQDVERHGIDSNERPVRGLDGSGGAPGVAVVYFSVCDTGAERAEPVEH